MLFDYSLLLTQRTQPMVYQTHDILEALLKEAFSREYCVCATCGYAIYYDQEYFHFYGKYYHTPDTKCPTSYGFPPILHEQNP